MDPKPQEIPIDSAVYIQTLEAQLQELSVEILRLRAIVTQMVTTAIERETEYQTDENGELLELEEANDER